MPAVNPTRLRFQIEALMAFFHSPSVFHQHLRGLFSLYANGAFRYGDSTTLKPLIPMYHLPAPVMRQLHLDLKPNIDKDPQAALALADELWNDTFLEVQQTALFILSVLPVDEPEPILTRLEKWLTPGLDPMLTAHLFSTGTLRLQTDFPDAWEAFIGSYLNQDDPKRIALGIQGLTYGLQNPHFKNLPAIYRLISPFIRRLDRKLTRYLVQLIEVLARRSPTETAYFLRQVLSVSETAETKRLIRQCLPFFSESIRQDLKSMVRKK